MNSLKGVKKGINEEFYRDSYRGFLETIAPLGLRAYPKGPKYLYGTKYGFCSSNFPYGLGKYSPCGYLGPFGLGPMFFPYSLSIRFLWTFASRPNSIHQALDIRYPL